MCDDIELPDGTMVHSVREDQKCLCNSTDEEIVLWIYRWAKAHGFELSFKKEKALCITRTAFGWVVQMKDADGDGV